MLSWRHFNTLPSQEIKSKQNTLLQRPKVGNCGSHTHTHTLSLSHTHRQRLFFPKRKHPRNTHAACKQKEASAMAFQSSYLSTCNVFPLARFHLHYWNGHPSIHPSNHLMLHLKGFYPLVTSPRQTRQKGIHTYVYVHFLP